MNTNPDFLFPASSVAMPASQFSVPATTITLPANSFGPGFPPVPVPITIPPQTVNVPAQTVAIPQQDVKLMNRDNLVGSLDAMFPLYTGGVRGSRIKQAKFGLQVANEESRRTDLEVVYDVTRLYYAVVLAGQLVQIGNDSLARMETTLNLTEQFYKTGSGKVKKTDYLRTKSITESLRSVVEDLESRKQIMQAALITVMGMDWNSKIELADSEVPFAPRDCDPQELVEIAYKSNPEIARVEAAVGAAEAGITVAHSGHIPKVGLFGSAHHVWDSYDAGVVTPNNKDNWTVGIGVDIPIFEGFRVTNEEREARANLQKLQNQLALLRQGIALEVQNSYQDLVKTQKQQASTHEALQAAVEDRELNVRAYQEELVETRDVIEAQLMEALFSSQYQKVLYDHVEALAKLDLVLGQAASN
jgi:outer membrane protein TolC